MNVAGRVLFVCSHGAGRSRVAAAVFDRAASKRRGLVGWRAVTAGVEPAGSVSEHAVRLLADTPEKSFLDLCPPRSVAAAEIGSVDRVVAIDCALDAGISRTARRMPWHLTGEWPDPAVLTELRELVTELVDELEEQAGG